MAMPKCDRFHCDATAVIRLRGRLGFVESYCDDHDPTTDESGDEPQERQQHE